MERRYVSESGSIFPHNNIHISVALPYLPIHVCIYTE